jgi:hypothetical protein
MTKKSDIAVSVLLLCSTIKNKTRVQNHKGCIPGTGTGTTELLGLAATGISDEEGTVVLEEDLLELVLGGLIDVLLVVGNDGLGKSLTDSIDLGSVSTTLDADADVDVGELVRANAEDGLVDLELQDIGLNELNGGTVEADETLTGLAVSNGGGGFLLVWGRKREWEGLFG